MGSIQTDSVVDQVFALSVMALVLLMACSDVMSNASATPRGCSKHKWVLSCKSTGI
jgi:hypothetical protein